jgi:rubrerythrin
MSNTTEALKIALEMERKGHAIYMAAAAQTENKLGRATLAAIAAKELDHIKAIQAFCLLPEEKAGQIGEQIEDIRYRDKKEYILSIMDNIRQKLEERISANHDLVEAYGVAMDLEKQSYDFYEKLFESAVNPSVKDFFKFLMGEENNHYVILQETLEYLDHPGDWFREQERWLVEG